MSSRLIAGARKRCTWATNDGHFVAVIEVIIFPMIASSRLSRYSVWVRLPRSSLVRLKFISRQRLVFTTDLRTLQASSIAFSMRLWGASRRSTLPNKFILMQNCFSLTTVARRIVYYQHNCRFDNIHLPFSAFAFSDVNDPRCIAWCSIPSEEIEPITWMFAPELPDATTLQRLPFRTCQISW